MRILLMIFVLIGAVFLLIPIVSGQGVLFWQSKTTQLGTTALKCQYVSGLSTFETVSRYEAWAYPNKVCSVLAPIED